MNKILMLLVLVAVVLTACGESRMCCEALNAYCGAMCEGITVEEYCTKNPTMYGCEEPQVCCKALTAECMACAEGTSVEEYCVTNPQTTGCPEQDPSVLQP